MVAKPRKHLKVVPEPSATNVAINATNVAPEPDEPLPNISEHMENLQKLRHGNRPLNPIPYPGRTPPRE